MYLLWKSESVEESEVKVSVWVYGVDTEHWQTDLFVNPVLVDGPDSGHMGNWEQLGERHPLVTGPATDQPGLTHGIVAHQDTLDQLRPRLLVIHLSLLLQTVHCVQLTSVQAGQLSSHLSTGNISRYEIF